MPPDRPTPKQEAMGHWDSARQANSDATEAWADNDHDAAIRHIVWANVALEQAVRVLIDQVPE